MGATFLATRSEALKLKFSVRELDITTLTPRPEKAWEISDPKRRYNPEQEGVIGWIVVADTSLSRSGVAKGGTAMYPGCDLATTNAKAHVMAPKQVFCHPIGLTPTYDPWGGGKSGIDFAKFVDGTREAELVWRGFVQAAWDAGIVPRYYIFGLDVGMNEHAARVAVDQVESLLIMTGKPADLGGIPYDRDGLAGRGAALVATMLCTAKNFALFHPSTQVVIHGFGAVGMGVARGLLEGVAGNGALPAVVAVSDGTPDGRVYSLYDPSGLDIGCLLALKRSGHNIADYCDDHPEAELLRPGDELMLPMDVLFLTASVQNVITARVVSRLLAKVVVQGANLAVTTEAMALMHQYGKLSLPDYATNYASAASAYLEYAFAGSNEFDLVGKAWRYIEQLILHNTELILQIIEKTGRPPYEICNIVCELEFSKAEMRKLIRSSEYLKARMREAGFPQD